MPVVKLGVTDWAAAGAEIIHNDSSKRFMTVDFSLHSHYTLMTLPPPEEKNWIKTLVSNFVPAGVMVWSLGILTASYFGYAKAVDSAFISSLVTTVLASYGINRIEQNKRR